MSWALINADGTWASGPADEEPTPAAGQSVVVVALGYPDTVAWSAARRGFVDILAAQPLISVGRFISLFTLAEQVAIHTASDSNVQLRAILYMLQGFTDGVSLSDPALVGFVQMLVGAGLITTDRATAILAGQAPS